MLADTNHDTDRPGVDERYATAANATSLAVIPHRPGAVDVLAAVAWSPTRIGAQLLRLHSEFDGGQRARQAVHMEGGRQVVSTDAKLLAMRLRSMAGAREQLTLQALKWEMVGAEEKARNAINWWLDRMCQQCNGRRWKVVKGTPSLSGQACDVCHGSGEQRIPGGADGRKLVVFIEDCVSRARQSIRQRLSDRR